MGCLIFHVKGHEVFMDVAHIWWLLFVPLSLIIYISASSLKHPPSSLSIDLKARFGTTHIALICYIRSFYIQVRPKSEIRVSLNLHCLTSPPSNSRSKKEATSETSTPSLLSVPTTMSSRSKKSSHGGHSSSSRGSRRTTQVSQGLFFVTFPCLLLAHALS